MKVLACRSRRSPSKAFAALAAPAPRSPSRAAPLSPIARHAQQHTSDTSTWIRVADFMPTHTSPLGAWGLTPMETHSPEPEPRRRRGSPPGSKLCTVGSISTANVAAYYHREVKKRHTDVPSAFTICGCGTSSLAEEPQQRSLSGPSETRPLHTLGAPASSFETDGAATLLEPRSSPTRLRALPSRQLLSVTASTSTMKAAASVTRLITPFRTMSPRPPPYPRPPPESTPSPPLPDSILSSFQPPDMATAKAKSDA